MGVRKNQAKLSPAERKAFVAAVLAQKQRPSRLHPGSARHNRYDDFVEVHRNAMVVMMQTPPAPSWGHMAAAFGPWHRVLLLEFERELQTVDPVVTIPYWDWTVDQSAGGSLWADDFLGGDGSDETGRVATGPFAGSTGKWPVRVGDADDDSDYLRRRMGKEATAKALPSASLQARILLRTPYDVPPWDDMLRDQNSPAHWQGFRIGLESALHNLVHRWVGGNMLDMTSPNDPVFWLHHANCDRLWALWQFSQIAPAAYLPVTDGPMGHNLRDTMIFHAKGQPAPWDRGYTPLDVLDHRTLGMGYDTDPLGAPPLRPPAQPAAPMGIQTEGPAHPHHHAHALPMFALPADIPALRPQRLEP